MSPWIVFALLTAVVLALVLWPLLRAFSAKERAREDYDLDVFRAQLAEVDRDLESGVLAAEQAEAMRTEIKRRMLRAASERDNTATQGKTPWRDWRVAAIVAVLLPSGAFGLYGVLGSPTLPDMPHTGSQAAQMGVDQEGAAAIQAMVDSLASRLQANPNDGAGWAMLGRSYKVMGRLDDAIDALNRAMELSEGANPDVLGLTGEVMVARAQGMVVPEARQMFLKALERAPQDPRARFYLGLARAQIGDAPGAIAVWRDLEAEAPAGAPWLAVLQQQIKGVGAAAGIDPATIAPKPETALLGTATPGAAPGAIPGARPAPLSPENAAEGSPEKVRQRVQALASRLEKNPGDGDGWAMLARSYQAMGEKLQAQEAWRRAITAKPKDIGYRMSYAETLLGDEDRLPRDFVKAMRDILDIDPKHQDALYYVGLGEIQAGRKAEGKRMWQALLATLDKNSQEYQSLSQEIEALGSAR